jgi:hypothetical protein
MRYALLVVLVAYGVAAPAKKPPGDSAVVTGSSNEHGLYHWERFQVLAVDGRFVHRPFFGDITKAKAVVDPGVHRVVVEGSFATRFNDGGPFEATIALTFDAKAQGSYRCVGRVSDNLIEAWVEDAVSGERVSDMASGPWHSREATTTIPIIVPAR